MIKMWAALIKSLYLQVLQTLFERADEVGDLFILHGQCVSDLPQRLLKETQGNMMQVFSLLHVIEI